MVRSKDALGANTAGAIYLTWRAGWLQGLPVIRACDKDVQKFCLLDAARKADPQAGGVLPAKGKHGVLGHEAAAMPLGQVS